MIENSAVYNSELSPVGIKIGNNILPNTGQNSPNMQTNFKNSINREFPRGIISYPIDKIKKRKKIMCFEEFINQSAVQ